MGYKFYNAKENIWTISLIQLTRIAYIKCYLAKKDNGNSRTDTCFSITARTRWLSSNKKNTILSYHAETFILPRKLKTVTMTAYPLKHEHKIPL